MTDARNILVNPDELDDTNQSNELDVEEQEQELEAAAAANADDDEIPEKYRGKSVKDIIEMHRNAEKALGAKNNEIGQWRSITAELIDSKADADLDEGEADLELSSDDLFDNPKEAIRKVVERELQARLNPVEQRIQQEDLSRAEAAFIDKHADAAEVSNSQEFVQWIQRSEYRVADAAKAAQGDLNAADRLLSDYKDLQPQAESKPQPKETDSSGVEAARRVATERGGSSGAVSSKKTYDATDIARMIQRDPQKYRSPEFQDELKLAIKEGRVRGL